MSFDMQDVAKRAAVDDAFEFAHRRKATPVVATAQRHAGIAAGYNRPHGLGAGESKRLFAPHRLASCRDSGHLLDVEGVGRGEKNCVDVGIARRICKLGCQCELMLVSKVARPHGIAYHAADEANAVGFALHGRDKRLTPAPKAANGSSDHGFPRARFRPDSGQVWAPAVSHRSWPGWSRPRRLNLSLRLKNASRRDKPGDDASMRAACCYFNNSPTLPESIFSPSAPRACRSCTKSRTASRA